MILLFPPPPLCQTFFCVLLRHFPSFPQFSFSFLPSQKKRKKRKKKERTRDDFFFPQIFFPSSFSRHTSINTREEDGGATNRTYKTRREREKERQSVRPRQKEKRQTMADDDERMPPRDVSLKRQMNDGGKK